MAGIYFHIPFCKKACHYCDFHFSTSLTYKKELLSAIARELELRREYLGGQGVETIYFGGGTPSLLEAGEISRILEKVQELFTVTPDAEVTLEANPDDLHPAKVRELRTTAINRFSVGVQSFFEEDLAWMNRAHTASEAESAIKRVQDAGFENITADLIYGYPLLTDLKWETNTRKMVAFDVPHISAYAMTVEERTPLASFIRKGKQEKMNEQQSAAQLLELMSRLEALEYEQYEISNFCKPGWRSRHNSNYWNGVSYLGIGPSAHSFNGVSRQWNPANNAKYTDALATGHVPAELEILTAADRLNEYLMTGLRKREGISRKTIRELHEEHLVQVEQDIQPFIEREWVVENGDAYRLTRQGKLFADHVASALMLV